MAKSRDVKNLNNVGNLFGSNQEEASFAVQLRDSRIKALIHGDVRDAVLELMSDYRGRTIADIQQQLASHPEASLIPIIVTKFANEGKFETMTIPGRANSYTLKNQVQTTSLVNAKPTQWVHRDPVGTRQAPDQKGVIRLEEGMDVAIWKVMADYKPRTATDIRLILAEYRFDARALDRRIDSLIRSNRWFDRKSRSSGTLYTLKKDFPMPALPNTPMNQANQQAQTTSIKDSVSEAIATVYPSLTQPNVVVEEPPVQEQPAITTEQATPASEVHHILPTDTLAIAVWKALSDYKPYSTAEIALLLQCLNEDLKPESVVARVSNMYADGMLERTRVPGTRGFLYTLKKGVPMPEKAHTRQTALQTTESAAEVPETQSQDNTETQDNTDMSQQTKSNAAPRLVQVNNAAAEKVELIELAITIKGEKFTFRECDQLVDELKSLGYGQTLNKTLSLVNQTVTIKSNEFKKDELDTLVNTLAAEGFGSTQRKS